MAKNSIDVILRLKGAAAFNKQASGAAKETEKIGTAGKKAGKGMGAMGKASSVGAWDGVEIYEDWGYQEQQPGDVVSPFVQRVTLVKMGNPLPLPEIWREESRPVIPVVLRHDQAAGWRVLRLPRRDGAEQTHPIFDPTGWEPESDEEAPLA
jgi:hypothetical protein